MKLYVSSECNEFFLSSIPFYTKNGVFAEVYQTFSFSTLHFVVNIRFADFILLLKSMSWYFYCNFLLSEKKNNRNQIKRNQNNTNKQRK